ncbi:glycosyltransferase family 4 protein [Marinifilum sp. D737]|uniref:glycosyltransferase family 4 protein n=1 Tax=Marinifilum sp. D737 TaxID=2969628 RepID=UPI002273F565|nr:glycosyltransferase family 4 protein [Marinifilum sp. D737]MCY1635007.1 glycosyltransferase family 4 protein [Marinifilum sp. D737]
MKKVLILHPAHWEQTMGGAELQISYLVNMLKDKNYEVHFMYEDNGKQISNVTKLKLHPLKRIKGKNKLGKGWILYRKSIFQKFNEIQPDAIYTRLYSSWSGFAANYAKQQSVNHILAVASDSDLMRVQGKVSLLKPLDVFEKKLVSVAYNNATYILTQNKIQQELLRKYFNRTGIRINQSTQFCKEDNIKKDNEIIKIIWIANFKKIKRPELYVKLVEKFEKIPNINFTMIGRSDEVYNELIDRAEKISSFKYLGEMSNPEVNKYLLESHILINTSDYEGFSNTFVQAWMRKVVVLSMNSNPDEIISNQQIGFICPTIEELSSKIELLVENKILREDMSNKAYQYAIENHSIEKNLDKVISLF